MAQDFHRRGERTEEEASLLYHARGVPLLVSPLILRSLGLGQVDVCYFDGRKGLVIVESKTRGHVSPRQRRRLLKSCAFLGAIFKRTARLEYFSLENQNATL